ncbi:uncharacterized protein TRIADDRAFT_56952 [Trichoplax adhaerens]|uniref:Cytochrome P450 10 n=1 Tax=Trichoplax adhaerens TaxID=10228 RepID=B3RX08_TRIAD|nr:hypothetical protein TRIADDRAFT_56952 [Trichoplax adhaerens]EDV24787.1 hypothetical protein TRIADDRAFT_56952 [Trichoplax adhaerens]|eukprot:XP_002112677.1 hypothetical protein TRIADDRAFT_56952 [Trichoplax adhaerens]
MQSTPPTAAQKLDDEEKIANAKPYTQVPGPKGYPIIGTLWTLLKNNGFYQKRPHLLFAEYKKTYGPIFKDKIGNMELVFISTPEDVATMFSAEGKYPSKGPVNPWVIYREQRKKPKGVLIGEGEDWRRSRSVMDKKLLKLKDVSAYSERINQVITDLIAHIRQKRITDNRNGELANLKDALCKWAFETNNTILFNKRLGAFNDPPTPIAKRFYETVCQMLEVTGQFMLLPPYYKYIKTKGWKAYCSYWDTLFEIGGKLIEEERNRLSSTEINLLNNRQNKQRTEDLEFLPYVLSRGELNDEEIASNMIELMMAGVDTTATTILWTLFILGKNPDIQDKLYHEVSSVLKDGELPDSQTLQKMPYLRGVIKESQRLYPVVHATARILDQDVVLSGYHIPAKTRVLALMHLISRDESIFEEATKIKPERWIRSSASSQHQRLPFSIISFGLGPRMCIGRRIAELQMELTIARLISEFHVDCRNENEIGATFSLVASPDQDLQIAFQPRN